MEGFIPVAKNLWEAIGYSALDLSRNITPGKVAASIATGIGEAALMHNDEHPVISTVGGYALGDFAAISTIIAYGARKYLR